LKAIDEFINTIPFCYAARECRNFGVVRCKDESSKSVGNWNILKLKVMN